MNKVLLWRTRNGTKRLESSDVQQKQKDFNEEICVIIVSVSTEGKY